MTRWNLLPPSSTLNCVSLYTMIPYTMIMVITIFYERSCGNVIVLVQLQSPWSQSNLMTTESYADTFDVVTISHYNIITMELLIVGYIVLAVFFYIFLILINIHPIVSLDACIFGSLVTHWRCTRFPPLPPCECRLHVVQGCLWLGLGTNLQFLQETPGVCVDAH